MTSVDIATTQSDIWAFRAEAEYVWPTPNTQDALRFACTEAAETIDANLRLVGGYARNHAKEPSVVNELADTFMMLVTALGKGYTFGLDVNKCDYPWDKTYAFDYIYYLCGLALHKYNSEEITSKDGNKVSFAWHVDAEYAIGIIMWTMNELGVDCGQVVTDRMQRIREKNCTVSSL
jgi:hypothetical protein